ncbi:hypothetical protein D3C81_1204440 [compost metagenome]
MLFKLSAISPVSSFASMSQTSVRSPFEILFKENTIFLIFFVMELVNNIDIRIASPTIAKVIIPIVNIKAFTSEFIFDSSIPIKNIPITLFELSFIGTYFALYLESSTLADPIYSFSFVKTSFATSSDTFVPTALLPSVITFVATLVSPRNIVVGEFVASLTVSTKSVLLFITVFPL